MQEPHAGLLYHTKILINSTNTLQSYQRLGSIRFSHGYAIDLTISIDNSYYKSAVLFI